MAWCNNCQCDSSGRCRFDHWCALNYAARLEAAEERVADLESELRSAEERCLELRYGDDL